jgi:hypothetical protein
MCLQKATCLSSHGYQVSVSKGNKRETVKESTAWLKIGSYLVFLTCKTAETILGEEKRDKTHL